MLARLALGVGLLALGSAAHALDGDQLVARSLGELTIEELGEVTVTSVSLRPQSLSEAAASIYVIENEALRRSGAHTLPEALRLAPNLEVGALDSRQYAVTARGFLTNIANKLLVLVDGRTVYSPLFSGVFWDAQDLLLEDVERIEVISGPGGVTWGTNAVNGIINVIRRPAAATRGRFGEAVLGEREQMLAARYGGSLGEATAFRLYGKALARDRSVPLAGGTSFDAWHRSMVGGRVDWSGGDDRLVFEAEAYDGATESRPDYGSATLSGGHVLARWSRALADAGDVEVQAYVDRTLRRDRYLLQEGANVADVEVRRRLTLGGHHRWVFGGGLRHASSRSEPGNLFAFMPPDRRLTWGNVFAQDQFVLAPALEATLGVRLERNPYSGVEALPSARLGWNLTPHDLLWASLSRAVRSPARLDREIFFPTAPPFIVAGGPSFDSEVAKVLELGYRAQPSAEFTVSLTGFVNDFDRLRSAQVTDQGTVLIDNRIAGQVRGLEAWAQWRLGERWRLDGGLLLLDKALHLTEGSNDPVGPRNLGNDPRAQWNLHAAVSLTPWQDLDIALRHQGPLPAPAVPSYTAVDLRWGWRGESGFALGLGVRNAFDALHLEYDPGQFTTEQRRSAFVELRWRLP